MEKKLYENPVLEVMTLIEEDVMTASVVWAASGDGSSTDYSELF